MSQKINHEKRNKLDKSKHNLYPDYSSENADLKIEYIGVHSSDTSFTKLKNFKQLKDLMEIISKQSFSHKSLSSRTATIDIAQRIHTDLINSRPEPNTYIDSKEFRIYLRLLNANAYLIKIRDEQLLEKMSKLLNEENHRGRRKKIRLLDEKIRLYTQDLSLYTSSNIVKKTIAELSNR